MYLKDLTVEAIEDAVKNLLELSDAEVKEQITTCQMDALWRYSRKRYRDVMRGHLEEALCKK
jgi:hypothetical protein